MRARMVVVDEELTEYGFKTPAAEDEKVIERLSAAAPIQRSANEFVRGLRQGRPMPGPD